VYSGVRVTHEFLIGFVQIPQLALEANGVKPAISRAASPLVLYDLSCSKHQRCIALEQMLKNVQYQ